MINKIFFIVFFLLHAVAKATNLHEINFRWSNLYPKSFIWDSTSDHFIVGSLIHQNLISVSDVGVTSSLLSSAAASLPPSTSFLALALEPQNRTILFAIVQRREPLFNALTSYDLRTLRQLFLTPLDDLLSSPIQANDVALDYNGNAYITDSANDVIFKVNQNGVASILSESKLFKSYPVDHTNKCGLNGVVYNSKGYLLVTQSNTGKLFKVDVADGTAKRVILNKDLPAADGIAVRSDSVVLVVSRYKLYFIKSHDSWSEGAVFDEIPLEEEKQASAVTVGAKDRIYVLYGHVDEGIMGNKEREEFSIVEVQSEKESEGDKVLIFVLIGLGLAYFMFWRFQMKQLVNNMNKKTR